MIFNLLNVMVNYVIAAAPLTLLDYIINCTFVVDFFVLIETVSSNLAGEQTLILY